MSRKSDTPHKVGDAERKKRDRQRTALTRVGDDGYDVAIKNRGQGI